MADIDVVIAGAGPIGMTTAVELARRGVAVRIVDPLTEPPHYAKAIGVQPRTLEIFEGMGILREILDASVQMRGQIVFRDGAEVGRIDLELPPDVPFQFVLIPQYSTEQVLRDELGRRGVTVERGVRLTGFTQDADGVTATVAGPSGEHPVRASYLVGADGAHSVVRKTLGATFEGAAFEEQYMLGDVEVDWSFPRGYAIRASRAREGLPDDILVCIPLPGRGRYRMSMLVPDALSVTSGPAQSDGIEHGFQDASGPQLADIQAVLDRLAPEPTTARNLRWSSVFKISHRIVNSYGAGRVFIAGDAAHIHPPTGAQGMNTGIQDAHNLAWKLALAVKGISSDSLLDSYDAERRPVGEEVVGRTVHNARKGIGADTGDVSYVMRREAQLLIDYAASPIVGGGSEGGPQPGQRAPDAKGLVRDVITDPIRLFSLLGRDRHTTLLYVNAGFAADPSTDVAAIEASAAAIVDAAHGEMDVYVVAAPDAPVADTVLPLVRDADGDFARNYAASAAATYVLRPDGYLGFVGAGVGGGDAVEHLRRTFRQV